jgi:hypothetical protein
MFRRILVGALIAGSVFGASATAVSAESQPYPTNDKQNASPFGIAILNDLIDDSLNEVAQEIDVLTIAHIEEIKANLLTNNHNEVVDDL